MFAIDTSHSTSVSCWWYLMIGTRACNILRTCEHPGRNNWSKSPIVSMCLWDVLLSVPVDALQWKTNLLLSLCCNHQNISIAKYHVKNSLFCYPITATQDLSRTPFSQTRLPMSQTVGQIHTGTFLATPILSVLPLKTSASFQCHLILLCCEVSSFDLRPKNMTWTLWKKLWKLLTSSAFCSASLISKSFNIRVPFSASILADWESLSFGDLPLDALNHRNVECTGTIWLSSKYDVWSNTFFTSSSLLNSTIIKCWKQTNVAMKSYKIYYTIGSTPAV